MSHMRHHAIVVTGGDWGTPTISDVYRRVRELVILLPKPGLPHNISELSPELVNGYRSFSVWPDGSKEGWEDSRLGDSRRREILAYLDSVRHVDGGSPVAWVEVQFGDDEFRTCVVTHSEDPERVPLAAEMRPYYVAAAEKWKR